MYLDPMAAIFRWLLRIFIGLSALAIGALALSFHLAWRSLPDYEAELQVEGVSGLVEIVRDNANVPHIFAETDEDVFFGLGYAHAQDRLWQMTMLRRTAQGRLSEFYGKRGLRVDELMRRLDIYGLSQHSVAAQDEETIAALHAYSDGVNARIARVNELGLGRGAPEFFLFPPQIAPWQPADSLALINLLGLQLSDQIQEEVLRARVSLALPEERVADILPDSPGNGIATLLDYAELFPSVTRFAIAAPDPRARFDPRPTRGLAGASNAWAADARRSAAGASLLANDPHMRFTAPSNWYLARLELESGGVIGGTIPGMPAILVGRSEALGWGLTLAFVDDQDLYVEKLNPDNPEEVLGPQGYRPMRSRVSVIEVRDATPVEVTLRWTDNGPTIPGNYYGLDSITPEGHVIALAWTALSPENGSMSAALGIMKARSIREAISAGERFVAPALNLTLADRETVAMKTIGSMPRRAESHQSRGRFPSPGWLPGNRWHGRLGYDVNPEFLAPPGGIVGNTNNKTLDRPFPYHVAFDWGDTQRVHRWRRLMQARETHTRESFIEAQLDAVSFTARTLLPLIGRDIWFTGEPAPADTLEGRRERALGLLAEWNGEMSEHLPEPLIYAAWMRFLQDRLIRDELGPLAREFPHVEPIFLERVFRDVDGAGVWCDVIQSEPRESCDEIARKALDDALIWIGETYGEAIESLRWGDAHQAAHDHQALGRIPLLRGIVNLRQSTSGGDHTLQRGRTSGSDPEPFLNVHGAGYRGVYDFANPNDSVFVIATGQSGHPLSRHYDDLGDLWRRGEYIPMSLDPDLARAAGAGITRLLPLPANLQ